MIDTLFVEYLQTRIAECRAALADREVPVDDKETVAAELVKIRARLERALTPRKPRSPSVLTGTSAHIDTEEDPTLDPEKEFA